MIKADKNKVNIRYHPSPRGELLSRNDPILSDLIRGKCRHQHKIQHKILASFYQLL